MVRSNFNEWNVNTARVSVCGSSAGDHLATLLAVNYNSFDVFSDDSLNLYLSRYDFMILFKETIDTSRVNKMINETGSNSSYEASQFLML